MNRCSLVFLPGSQNSRWKVWLVGRIREVLCFQAERVSVIIDFTLFAGECGSGVVPLASDLHPVGRALFTLLLCDGRHVPPPVFLP